MARILGIDEAGRGAVIGPLVVAGALAEEKDLQKLKELGVRDSKELTPKRREALFLEIKKILKTAKLVEVQPQEIDSNKLSGGNLNELEAKKMASIINELKPDEVFVDAVDSIEKNFVARLKIHLRVDTKITAEHAADKKYPIVSAASILAKVTRDSRIGELKGLYGEIGSGYPSDGVTKNFLRDWLKKHGSFPRVVRKTWGTVSSALGSKKQKKLEDFAK